MKLKLPGCLVTIIVVASIPLVAGCAMFGTSSHHASSVMQYLYPKDTQHTDAPAVPVLSLPLKVGIAFVPEDRGQSRGGVFVPQENASFTEKQKMALMKEVSDNFKKYPFVQSIELIPSAYVTPRGGFANLEQLRSMFGVDVITLLSYDQVQFTDQGLLSLTYWTVVGAYVVQGEKNDTKTLMDAVVYDIPSRKLLFRAPGTSQIKAAATPVNLSEQLRRDGERGLNQAATNMVSNLQEQLQLFRERVKSSPTEFKVVAKPGYKGGGSLGAGDLLMLAGMGLFFLWPRKTRPA
jgi:rhombotail lipoprotein